MTMIASLINDANPILIADILISSSIKPNSTKLPTIGEDIIQYVVGTPQFYPDSFNQKLYILQPHICIAFAGNHQTIKNILEDVTVFCNAKINLPPKEFIDKLTELRQLYSSNDFACLIHIIINDLGKEGVLRAVYPQDEPVVSTLFGDIIVKGTGNKSFVEEALVHASLRSTGPTDKYIETIQLNAIIICRLLCREHYNLHTIANFWGGGFELAYVNNGEFQKIDNITYVINRSKFDDAGKLSFPRPSVVMNYRYTNGILLITSIMPQTTFLSENTEEYILDSDDLSINYFQVLPIGRLIPTDSQEVVEFRSSRIAMGYIFEYEHGIYNPASFHTGPDLTVEYTEATGLKIIMKKDINDNLVTDAEDKLPSLLEQG